MRIAVPVNQGKLSAHFGHCDHFALIEVDTHDKTIIGQDTATPPPHEPGVLPAWLADLGVDLVLAGGMGGRAQQALNARDVQVIVGVPELDPETLVRAWLQGELPSGLNSCDH